MTAINQITANPASALVGFAGYGAPFRIPRTTAARNQPVIFRFSGGLAVAWELFALVRLAARPAIGRVGSPRLSRLAPSWPHEMTCRQGVKIQMPSGCVTWPPVQFNPSIAH